MEKGSNLCCGSLETMSMDYVLQSSLAAPDTTTDSLLQVETQAGPLIQYTELSTPGSF